MNAVKFKEFQRRESIGQAMLQVASGSLDAALIRNVLAPDACLAMTRNFLCSPARIRRADGVPGFIVGTTHYGKSPLAYFSECASHGQDVDSLFIGTDDPMRIVHQEMRSQLHALVRPSSFQGMNAAHARAVEWLPDPTGASEFLLLPHEDISQVECGRNAQWEMQGISRVLALNFYTEVKAGEGQLRVYDFAPDRQTRISLGLDTTGYPYPPEVFEDKTYIDLAVQSRDLAIICGNMLHAVTRTSARRIVINSFMGQVAEREFAYWT